MNSWNIDVYKSKIVCDGPRSETIAYTAYE